MLKIKPKRQNNGLSVCRHILNLYEVKHTRTHLEQFLEDHVDYPSLLSLKDGLMHYGIESVAIRRGTYSYADFEAPFVCSIQQEDWPQSAFVVVTACDGETITYLHPLTHKLVGHPIGEFERIDKEIVLLLDGSHKKDEESYRNNKRRESKDLFLSKIPAYALLAIVLLSLGMQLTATSSFHWVSPIFLLSATIGLAIAGLLVWHDVDAHNPFLKEVCGGNKNSKLNCDAVLSSTGAKFLGISWSIWGFAYFGTFFSNLVISAGHLDYILLWSWISVATVAYIPYSIYYQSRIVKQWCPLCLATQGVIGINALLGMAFLLQNPALTLSSFQPIFNLCFVGLSLLFLTYYAVPLLKKAGEARSFEKRWKKLRFNPDVFQSLLQKSTPVTVSADSLGILVGNPDAKNEIIKVCNPYCGPCSSAHPELEHIIKHNPDVRLRIIFTANGEEGDIRTPPVSHLLAIQERDGKDHVQQALDDWYLADEKDYDAFAEKYPMNGELKQQQDKIHAMRDWCAAMKIRATPTIFINGQELPDSYRIAELKNFF